MRSLQLSSPIGDVVFVFLLIEPISVFMGLAFFFERLFWISLVPPLAGQVRSNIGFRSFSKKEGISKPAMHFGNWESGKHLHKLGSNPKLEEGISSKIFITHVTIPSASSDKIKLARSILKTMVTDPEDLSRIIRIISLFFLCNLFLGFRLNRTAQVKFPDHRRRYGTDLLNLHHITGKSLIHHLICSGSRSIPGLCLLERTRKRQCSLRSASPRDRVIGSVIGLRRSPLDRSGREGGDSGG